MTGVPMLIPVNHLDRAKGRLAGLLNAEERETLALITLETVLRAAGDGAIVLTPDQRVADHAAGRSRVIPETAGVSGLNAQLEHAMRRLMADGTATDRLLILHADLPLASEIAVQTLIGIAGQRSVVMVESRDGGTNAMLFSPPGLFPLHYGPGSYAKHAAAANAAGMSVVANGNRELRLDLDTPDDIRELLRAPRGRQGAAGRYLLSIGIEGRLEKLP